MKLYISADGGETYGSDILPSNTGAGGWYAVTNISIPAASLANLCLKFSSSTNTNRLDDIKITGVSAAPVAPTFDPVAGDFSEAFTLHLASATDGATIYYEKTIDGSTPDDPTSSSTEYVPASGISISAGSTVKIKAIAIKDDVSSTVSSATYTYKNIANPVFTPTGGSTVLYGGSVEISCATSGAKIYYTQGSTPADPTSASTEYTTPIVLTAGTTIKAIAINGGHESDVVSATYSVKATAPTFSVAAGTYNATQSVELSTTTEGATIYYTTNGSTPTNESTEYTGAISVFSSQTIKAIAIKTGLTNSDVSSSTYTLKCAKPTFSVAEGDYSETQSVELSCATAGASIYYTTNGSTPTSSSTLYSSAISVSDIKTIKAIAIKSGWSNSDVASAEYRVVLPATLPFSFDGGKSDVASKTGLTQSGLGSDYKNSPYLKFDDTGDYVILKFTGCPNVLSFDITGNSFSGGTFKVQYSDDGSSFTDLSTYDDLGDKQNESFNNIPTSARYIKWIYTSKSSGNVGLGNISLNECEPITIGGAGYTTHVTSHKVSMPAGVTAYIATNATGSTITLSSIDKVPASTAIVLKAAAGSYKLPVITTAADDASGNILLASDGTVTVGDGDKIYALSNLDGPVGFYQVDTDVTIPAGKAYLDFSGSSAKAFLAFDFDEADGLRKIQDSSAKIQDAKIFNLAGQRMSKMQRGINIVNGKKVIVK